MLYKILARYPYMRIYSLLRSCFVRFSDLARYPYMRIYSAKNTNINVHTDYYVCSLPYRVYLLLKIISLTHTFSIFGRQVARKSSANTTVFLCELYIRTAFQFLFDYQVNIFYADILTCIIIGITFKTAFQTQKMSLCCSVTFVDISAFTASLTCILRFYEFEFDSVFFGFIFDFCLKVIVRPILQKAVGIFRNTCKVFHLNDTAVFLQSVIYKCLAVFMIGGFSEPCYFVTDG